MARRTLTELEYRLILEAMKLERERIASARGETYETMQWVARQHDPAAERVTLTGARDMEWQSPSDDERKPASDGAKQTTSHQPTIDLPHPPAG